jgi:signal peptidase I
VEEKIEENQIEETNPVVSPETTENAQTKEESGKSFFRDLVETVLMALILFVILNTITSRVKVFNVSMQPTLKEQDLLLVNKLAYRFGSPKHGDIIVFHFNGGDQDDYIKRVIGLPGDLVEIQGGVVRVNGQALTEPYIMDMPTYNGTWEVPPDELFVLGDNRNHSSDSHQWGTVKMEWVVGKALLVYWPPNKVKLLTIPDLVTAAP